MAETNKKTVKKAVTKKAADIKEVKETKSKDTTELKAVAKAGKRSPKAVKAAEEKQAKVERKTKAVEAIDTPKAKQAQKPARSKTERRSKKYREAAKQIDKSKDYALKEALELAAKTSTTKFDATVEVHLRLGVDPKQADQNIRDTVVLPSGTGKEVRVAALVDSNLAPAAKKAGADEAGEDELLNKLEKGQINFDVLIATPALMPKLGKYARLLGPKGLMPNPKSGTVTNDVAKAVSQAKAGRIEYRVDPTGIIHCAIGKTSFGAAKLTDNAQAVIESIKANKPASLKGNYINSIFVTTTMGPSIKVNL